MDRKWLLQHLGFRAVGGQQLLYILYVYVYTPTIYIYIYVHYQSEVWTQLLTGSVYIKKLNEKPSGDACFTPSPNGFN